MDKSPHILYITYDGLTDPLGQSQVIPYLQGLSKRGFRFTILSCEKRDRFVKYRADIERLLQPYGINWEPLSFHYSPPILAKIWDLWKLKTAARRLMKRFNFLLVHCRGYLPADVGFALKRRFGLKVVFDPRGFWVDERLGGGGWNLANPVYKFAYAYYKKKESYFVSDADSIVVLSKAGKSEIFKWRAYQGAPITVIPCCVDFEVFQLMNQQTRLEYRKKLGLNETDLVLSYLGSLGTWYMLDEMFLIFKITKMQYPSCKFLFITPHPETEVHAAARQHGVPEGEIRVVHAARSVVASYLAASDVSISFIRPSYGKIASSPTKLGEIWAIGLPVITNSGIGDVKEIVNSIEGGIVIDDFEQKTLGSASSQIPRLLKLHPTTIRRRAFEYYDLNRGVDEYERIYKELLN